MPIFLFWFIYLRMEFSVYHKSLGKSSDIENQDSYSIIQRTNYHDRNNSVEVIIAISDGMGGLDSPLEASNTAVSVSLDYLSSRRLIDYNQICNSIIRANNKLLNNKVGKDLGATLSVLYLKDNLLRFGHIGDCRIILFRGIRHDILTEDHSVTAEKYSVKNPSNDLTKENPLSKKLLKSLGEKVFDNNYIQYFDFVTQKEDIIVICTDGLWTEVDNYEIFSSISQNISGSASDLVNAAYERDSSDDISVIIIKLT